MEPMTALYVRIPASLHAKLKEAAQEGRTWNRKGAIQAFVIKALNAALPATSETKETKKTKKGGK